MNYDVVIAGAGPAGSSSARDLAAAGLKVLMLEEHSQVGKPLHCSGFVTPRTLKIADLSKDVLVSTIKGAQVYGPKGSTLELGGDRTRAFVLDRVLFDKKLAESAQEAGADLALANKLINITRVNGHVSLQILHNGTQRNITSSLLIGADGVRSIVAKWMGQQAKEVIWALGAEVEIEDHPADMAQVFVGTSVAPKWFAWTIPISRRRARIGIGIPFNNNGAGGLKPRHYFAKLLNEFPLQLKGLKILSFSGGFIPLYSSIRTYGNGTLLVGDAACQVKPTSGGGIYASLIAGRLAARTALDALRQNDTSAKMLANYEKAWKRAFGSEMERGLDIRRVYTSLGDQELRRVINVLGSRFLRRIIQRFGDIDYPSRMFAYLTLTSPPLKALQIVSVPISSKWLQIVSGLISKFLSRHKGDFTSHNR